MPECWLKPRRVAWGCAVVCVFLHFRGTCSHACPPGYSCSVLRPPSHPVPMQILSWLKLICPHFANVWVATFSTSARAYEVVEKLDPGWSAIPRYIFGREDLLTQGMQNCRIKGPRSLPPTVLACIGSGSKWEDGHRDGQSWVGWSGCQEKRTATGCTHTYLCVPARGLSGGGSVCEGRARSTGPGAGQLLGAGGKRRSGAGAEQRSRSRRMAGSERETANVQHAEPERMCSGACWSDKTQCLADGRMGVVAHTQMCGALGMWGVLPANRPHKSDAGLI